MDIHMDWWDAHQMLPRAYLTDEEHIITVKKESIPIVFVPGIMGSRLKRGKEKVWDPDSQWFMKQYVYASAKTRQQLLGSPGLEVDNKNSDVEDTVSSKPMKAAEDADHSYFIANDQYERAKQQGRDAIKQGWGGVAWKYYGGILQALAEHNWHPFNKVFEHPVYAVGYNWTQDNALSGNDLTAKIQSIIDDEKAKGRKLREGDPCQPFHGGFGVQSSRHAQWR